MASLDVESFLELMIGLCLIGATTLAAILPLLAIANHPTGPALITMVLSASALFGALMCESELAGRREERVKKLVDKIREQNKGELDD